MAGFRDTQDRMESVVSQKAELDQQKGLKLEDMSGLVGQLTMKIGERKARLAPIIKELRPLRQKCQNMEVSTGCSVLETVHICNCGGWRAMYFGTVANG